MNWLSRLTDGQVVGGLVFVVVPLVLLVMLWIEERLESRRVAREEAWKASTRGAAELRARRDKARRARRERVLAVNTRHPNRYRARLAAQKLREMRSEVRDE